MGKASGGNRGEAGHPLKRVSLINDLAKMALFEYDPYPLKLSFNVKGLGRLRGSFWGNTPEGGFLGVWGAQGGHPLQFLD